jgi:hypothetical protein
MTIKEAGQPYRHLSRGLSAPSLLCECLHDSSRAEAKLGHEFVDITGKALECNKPAHWQCYWECASRHIHVTAICDDCKGPHDTDAANGGVQVEWIPWNV